MYTDDHFPLEALYWFKKPFQESLIFRAIHCAEPSPGLTLWHARYDTLHCSLRNAQTQETLRIAGLASASAKRQAEFWAGRCLMMQAFGLQTPPGRMPYGAPHWPNGCNGSLSHSSDNILLLTGPVGTYIGVDIERLLKPAALQSVISRVATQAEQRWLYPQEALQQQFCATLLFSAKETLFKALCADGVLTPGYASVEVATPPRRGILTVKLTRSLDPSLGRGRCFNINYSQMNDFVLTWLFQSSI